MTPEMKHPGSFREKEATIGSGPPQLMANKSDLHPSNVMADELLYYAATRRLTRVNRECSCGNVVDSAVSMTSSSVHANNGPGVEPEV